MTKTTVTIPAIFMTKEEEHELWPKGREEWKKHDIRDWNTSDGRNEILFEGEMCYRVVIHEED
jgi:hypothetical protein